jgi:hypothetical protein
MNKILADGESSVEKYWKKKIKQLGKNIKLNPIEANAYSHRNFEKFIELKRWIKERKSILKKSDLKEIRKICKNCKEKIKHSVRLVKMTDGTVYCPVCHRAEWNKPNLPGKTIKQTQKILKSWEKEYDRKKREPAIATQRRRELIKKLGGKCARCGFDDIRALQIDHKLGDGAEDRLRFKNGLYLYSHYLENFNEARHRLQVLCANCNWIKKEENDENSWYRKRKAGKLEGQKMLKKYKKAVKKSKPTKL